jgi:NTE family protein
MTKRKKSQKRPAARAVPRASTSTPRRALVLAGGGARGSYQVGMLDYLVRTKNLDFQILRGVSVGALNSAFLAQAPAGPLPTDSLANLQTQTQALLDLWTTEITGNASIYRERPGGFAGFALGADSLDSVEGLKRLMAAHLDEGKLAASGRDFKVGYVSLVSGLYEERGPDAPSFRELVLASSAMPVIFPFVRRKVAGEPEDVLVDGGVRNITPLRSAFAADEPPDEIWVLLTSRVDPKPNGDLPDSAAKPESLDQWKDDFLGTKVSGIDVLKRSVELLTDEIYLGDLDTALDWNRLLAPVEKLLAAAGAGPLPPAFSSAIDELRTAAGALGKRAVPLYVLAPREWYGEQADDADRDNSAVNFSPAAISRAIAHGRAVAANPALWIRK